MMLIALSIYRLLDFLGPSEGGNVILTGWAGSHRHHLDDQVDQRKKDHKRRQGMKMGFVTSHWN